MGGTSHDFMSAEDGKRDLLYSIDRLGSGFNGGIGYTQVGRVKHVPIR